MPRRVSGQKGLPEAAAPWARLCSGGVLGIWRRSHALLSPGSYASVLCMKRNERNLLRLMEQLQQARRLLILTHDNPDPDAIASGWALRSIAQRTLGLRADLAYGGIVGRAENRALVRLLKIPLQHFSQVRRRLDRYDAVALVDTQPRAGNNSLPPGRSPDVVFDHHPLRRVTDAVPFHDVRPKYGAAATMLTEYLEAAHLEQDRRLCTALFYAIRSETQNLGREGTVADARAFVTLFPQVDNRIIARIEQAPYSREYLSLLNTAFRSTRIYGSLSITRLAEMPYPDVAAQLADLLLRVEEVRWALVVGVHGDRVYCSVRTEDRRANAGRMLRRVVASDGRAGGHGMMAGGRVDLRETGLSAAKVQYRLARRAREILGVQALRGEPLLGRNPRAKHE